MVNSWTRMRQVDFSVHWWQVSESAQVNVCSYAWDIIPSIVTPPKLHLIIRINLPLEEGLAFIYHCPQSHNAGPCFIGPNTGDNWCPFMVFYGNYRLQHKPGISVLLHHILSYLWNQNQQGASKIKAGKFTLNVQTPLPNRVSLPPKFSYPSPFWEITPQELCSHVSLPKSAQGSV